MLLLLIQNIRLGKKQFTKKMHAIKPHTINQSEN